LSGVRGRAPENFEFGALRGLLITPKLCNVAMKLYEKGLKVALHVGMLQHIGGTAYVRIRMLADGLVGRSPERYAMS